MSFHSECSLTNHRAQPLNVRGNIKISETFEINAPSANVQEIPMFKQYKQQRFMFFIINECIWLEDVLKLHSNIHKAASEFETTEFFFPSTLLFIHTFSSFVYCLLFFVILGCCPKSYGTPSEHKNRYCQLNSLFFLSA